MMTKRKVPLSGAPNGLQIWPPDEEQEVTAAPSRGSDNSFSLIFFWINVIL